MLPSKDTGTGARRRPRAAAPGDVALLGDVFGGDVAAFEMLLAGRGEAAA